MDQLYRGKGPPPARSPLSAQSSRDRVPAASGESASPARHPPPGTSGDGPGLPVGSLPPARDRSQLAQLCSDLRSRLSTIIGLTELTMQGELSPEQHSYLSESLDELDGVARLLELLRLRRRFAEPPREPVRSRVDLDGLVTRVKSEFGARLRRHQLRLGVTLDPAVPPVFLGDREYFRRLLELMLSLPLDMGISGNLHLAIRSDAERGAQQVLLKLGVSGVPSRLDPPGRPRMLARSLPEVIPGQTPWDPMELTRESLRQIVQALGGSLFMADSPCRELLKIRLKLEPVPSVEPSTDASAPPLVSPRRPLPDDSPARPRDVEVVLLEDNIVNQKLIERLLEKHGVHVTCFSTAAAALHYLSVHVPDLVLLDLVLPDQSGVQVARQLRQKYQELELSVPLLAMTAHVDAVTEQQCLAAGMDGFMSKPVRVEQLIGEIHRLVARSAKEDVLPVAGTDTATFDLSGALRQLGGNREILVDLIRCFLREADHTLERLHASLERGDDAGLLRELLKINTVAQQLRAGTLQGATRQLVGLIRAGSSPTRQRELLQALERIFLRLSINLEQVLADLEPVSASRA